MWYLGIKIRKERRYIRNVRGRFWVNIKHLLTGPKGNKINSFRRDQSLSYLLYNSRRKLFGVQISKHKSRERSPFAGNSALLSSDVIDFGGKQFHC